MRGERERRRQRRPPTPAKIHLRPSNHPTTSYVTYGVPGYRAGVQGAAGELYADYYVRFGARNPPARPPQTHSESPTPNPQRRLQP